MSDPITDDELDRCDSGGARRVPEGGRREVIDIGRKQVLFDSSFRYESAPNITHATNEAGDRTLCGRACADCVDQDADGFEPDCLVCNRIWHKRLGVFA